MENNLKEIQKVIKERLLLIYFNGWQMSEELAEDTARLIMKGIREKKKDIFKDL